MVMEDVHGNYKIKVLSKIGQGGFGYVEHIELYNVAGHKCGNYARKLLSPELNDEFRRRFAREVTYQASCVHNNIVHIYLCNLRAEQPWFVMNLAEGDLLKDLEAGNLSFTEKSDILRMIFNGVAYIHSRGFLHRDIKPNNVLRFNKSVYRVSDFGLVKNLDKDAESEVLTKIASAMGTTRYMAPEVLYAGDYSKQTDIFALGLLIEDLNLVEAPGIQRVIDKSTARRPLDRYAEVSDMLKDLNLALEGKGK